MDKYPLYLGGNEKGSLTVTREGLMTCFFAQCERQNGIVRLYIFGDGKKAYLGTMQPDDKGLYLRKRLSRAELSSFPQKIAYAADAPTATEENDTLWYEYKNGVLKSGDGMLTAFPYSGKNLPQKRLRVINGRQYMIFSGKISGGEQ